MTTSSTDAKHMLMACWKVNQAGNEEHLRELVDAIEAQVRIPGVLAIEHGPRTAQVDWEGPDKDFGYAMLVTFDGIGAVRAYPSHPLHQQLVGTIYYVGDDIRWFWMDC
ncbi:MULTISPECIES: Dabb family protein [Sphingobium]|uniref:Dabb family protein n=1 Tax=Sphingobium TaxID=165695 RepID=UPI00159C15FA|nr:Dabb family protein [Sphingobium sp. 15-1]